LTRIRFLFDDATGAEIDAAQAELRTRQNGTDPTE
jgi:hypothetical protein